MAKKKVAKKKKAAKRKAKQQKARQDQREQPQYLWTIMVYLAGDNNLTEESVFSLTEMTKVLRDNRIAVVAQLDPKSPRIPSHRYVINPRPPGAAQDTDAPGDGSVAAFAFGIDDAAPGSRFRAGAKAGGGETDTGDPATLFNFIKWALDNYKAEHHMVILAGHGAGTEEDFLLKDENPTNSLSMRALQAVFDAVKHRLGVTIDILGMDVCLMSMIEVCHQLNVRVCDPSQHGPAPVETLVNYLVSSESFSPTAGWPYGRILQRLQAEPDAAPEKLARMIVEEYIGFYSDYVVGGLSVDQSVLKVSASQKLVYAVRNLSDAMKRELQEPKFQDAIVLAHWQAQSYNGELFVDLRDFCDLLKTRYKGAEIVKACRAVTTAIKGLVVESGYTGVENQFSYGVSIYFPWDEVASEYNDLAFANDAGWDDFLQNYVKQTRRKPREFTRNAKELLNFPELRPFKFASGALGPAGFRKSDDRKSDDRGANPIHSMRNPPVSVVKEGLSKFVLKNEAAVRALEQFSNNLGAE